MGHLRTNVHKNKCTELLSEGVQLIKSAFRYRIASFRIIARSENEQNSIQSFFNNMSYQIKTLLGAALETNTCIKVNVELFSMFMLFKNNSQEMKSFATKNIILYKNYNFGDIFFYFLNSILKKVEEF